MDVFTNPDPGTYRLYTLFTIPTDSGGVRGVAVTNEQARYLLAVYTILITGIFGFAWQFFTYFVLISYPTEGPRSGQQKDGTQSSPEESLEIRRRKANRYVALVAIWNTSDPYTAILLLLEHAYLMFFTVKDHLTGGIDAFFLLLAVAMVGGSLVAGVLIPANLQIGNVAPANSQAVFFSTQAGSDPDLFQQQLLTIPLAQRVLGIVAVAKDQLRRRVILVGPEKMPWTGPNGEEVTRMRYKYNITGVDFGLQHASELVNAVEGACTLEWGWLDRTHPSADVYDIYNLFGSSELPDGVDSSLGRGRPPRAAIYLPETQELGRNKSYAVIPDTIGRESYTNGTDPWYTTIPIPDSCDGCPLYEVARGRPVLSCWQNDIWIYKGHEAETIRRLEFVPGLDIPSVLRDELIPFRLDNPTISNLATTLGDSVLLSSLGSILGWFDAESSNYFDDMQRLILSSFLISRDIIRDTTTMPNFSGLPNSAVDPSTGAPKPGAGDFVINSPAISTLSLNVLIIVPVIWLSIWVLLSVFRATRHPKRNSGKRSRINLRSVGLQAVQLYRLLDEEVCSDRDDWFGRKGHMPYIVKAREVRVRAPKTPAVEKQEAFISEKVIDSMPMRDTAAITPVMDLPPSRQALFIAPKVVRGPDERFHLKFTDSKEGKQYSWDWKAKDGSGAVADGPN